MKPMPTDPHLRRKQEILARCPYPEGLFTFDFRGSIKERSITPGLLWSARVISLSPEELDGAAAQTCFQGMVSTQNEKKAYESLRASLSAKLALLERGSHLEELESLEEVMASGSAPEPVAAVGTLGAWMDTSISDEQREWRSKTRKYAALVVLDDETRVTRSCIELLDEWLDNLIEEGGSLRFSDGKSGGGVSVE